MVAILAQPFMPASMAKLLDLIGRRGRRPPVRRRGAAPRADAGEPASGAGADLPALCRGRGRDAGLSISIRSTHADRQSLPSRFSRFRRRARRGRCARPRGRRRAHDHDFDPDREIRRDRRAGRALIPRCSARSANIRKTSTRRRKRISIAWSRSQPIQNASALARPASIIITTARRATPPREFFAPISKPRAATGLPLVIHSRDADRDMAEILADEMGKGAFQGRAALLHLVAANWRRRDLRWGCRSPFPAF